MFSCKIPQVPIRIISKLIFSSFSILFSKSILTSASNSLIVMSILSVPIPVDIAEILFPLYIPVWQTNSLCCDLCSIFSKNSETIGTRS